MIQDKEDGDEYPKGREKYLNRIRALTRGVQKCEAPPTIDGFDEIRNCGGGEERGTPIAHRNKACEMRP